MLIRDYLLSQALTSPQATSYIDGDRRYTWAETADRSMRLAQVFHEAGLRKGDVVASLGLDGIEVVEVWFASAILGTVRTGINWRYAPREVAHILQDAEVSAIVVEDGAPREILDRAESLPKPYTISFGAAECEYERLLAQAEPLHPDDWPELDDNDVIAISYTTGSTGLPKGAVWRHGAVVDAQLHTWLEAGGRRDDVYLHCIPAAGVPILLATWNVVFGSTIVLVDRFSAEQILRVASEEQVTSCLLVPTMISDIVNHDSFSSCDLTSLRLLIYGSAPTTSRLVARAIEGFGCEVQQWYGSTEGTGGWFTILRHVDHLRALDGQPELLRSCGRPMIHARIQIQDANGHPTPPGEVGEVCVRSSTVMSGYLNLTDETAQALRDGWLHTGDLGRFDEEGFLYLVDRKKFLIITGGYNVYPVVVEDVLAKHPAVREVCVVGVQDERWGEVVCAVVVPADENVSDEDLIAYCREHLADFEVPKRVILRSELPRGPTGKIQKRDVRAELNQLES